MTTNTFHTDSFRDLTFDLLSGIARDPTKFDEFNDAYIKKLHERTDGDDLKKYVKEIYEKLVSLQVVQTAPGVQLKDALHGKIIIIYVWAFSDINAIHMMRKMLAIDKRYAHAGVTIIGVHSPKYEHEKNKTNVKHAIEEQSLPFTVVNDNGLQVWKQIGCQVWPTVLVIGPDAYPIYIFEGENHVQHLETFLTPIMTYYQSSITATPVQGSPEDLNGKTSATEKPMTFSYPSHVCVTSHGQVCISFAGSNQLILCEVDGKVKDIVGTGEAGLVDGEIQIAQFDSPHGLVEFNSCIYIADTNNHAIRVFDPNSRRVLTLIGTGRLGTDKIGGLKRSQQPLASPWDLCITESPYDHKAVLLISMAGQHQIWAYAFEETQWWNDVILQKNSCSAVIGSGAEENKNSLDPMTAGLASPRGICNGIMNGESVVFIADSNSSTIRVVTIRDGNVSHLIGGDPDPANLSAFGDLDGVGYNAKLQHPLGVAFHYPTSQLYITDTFNNKLKRVDMKTLQCSSYFVTDNDPKKRDDSNTAKLNEPYGLAIFDHFMYVADKNNSQIKRIDLNQGTIVRCRFNWSETMNEDRVFVSKQAYLKINIPESLHLHETNAGKWTIQDEDGFKICDGELAGHTSDQMLLGYIPRDKQATKLNYEIMICNAEKCVMSKGEVEPVNITESTVEFTINITQTELN